MTPHSVKYRVNHFEYDIDYPNKTVMLRQRDYDYDGQYPTPITPLFLARVFTATAGKSAPVARKFDPRYIDVCYQNPSNIVGFTTRAAIIPYRPNDPSHKAHAAEILNYLNVEVGRYFGETYDSNTIKEFYGVPSQ